MSHQNHKIDELISNITSEINISLRNNLMGYLQLISNNNQIVDVLKGILFQMPEYTKLKEDYEKLQHRYEHVKKELIAQKKHPQNENYNLCLINNKLYYEDSGFGEYIYEYVDGNLGECCFKKWDLKDHEYNTVNVDEWFEKYCNNLYDNDTFKVVKLNVDEKKEQNIKFVVKEEKELEVTNPQPLPIPKNDNDPLNQREHGNNSSYRTLSREEQGEEQEEEQGENQGEEQEEELGENQGEEQGENQENEEENHLNRSEQGENKENPLNRREHSEEDEENEEEQEQEEDEEDEEDEEELEEIEFEGKTYNLNSKTNDVYEDVDGEVGEIIGILKNGKIEFIQ